MRKYRLIKDRDYIFIDFSATMGTDRHKIALFHEEFDFDRIAEDGYKKKFSLYAIQYQRHRRYMKNYPKEQMRYSCFIPDIFENIGISWKR